MSYIAQGFAPVALIPTIQTMTSKEGLEATRQQLEAVKLQQGISDAARIAALHQANITGGYAQAPASSGPTLWPLFLVLGVTAAVMLLR